MEIVLRSLGRVGNESPLRGNSFLRPIDGTPITILQNRQLGKTRLVSVILRRCLRSKKLLKTAGYA
jgi:hypothetical protein